MPYQTVHLPHPVTKITGPKPGVLRIIRPDLRRNIWRQRPDTHQYPRHGKERDIIILPDYSRSHPGVPNALSRHFAYFGKSCRHYVMLASSVEIKTVMFRSNFNYHPAFSVRINGTRRKTLHPLIRYR